MDAQVIESQVLTYVQRNGPVLPIQVSKVIEKDMFLTGAMLSELIRRGLIKITTSKIGGSPLYYSPGQESKLFILYNHLPLKEKQAYDLLKKETVMRDSETEPSIRVAFRNLRDFAVPFEFEAEDKKELFWRWHLTNMDEAKHILDQKQGKIEIPVQNMVKTEIQKIKIEPLVMKPEIAKVEMPLKPEKQERLKLKKKESDDLFLNHINNYLNEKKIRILKSEVIKKNSEIEMVVKVPSGLGELNYFLAAKNKKKISDADLLHAHQKAQESNMPALLISKGELSKKALKYLEDKLKGTVFIRI
ncbi:hypothetical protein HYT58_01665 [Candidatus Woesearchaeota archaeon]|nr:hypothetical protein [Candidatus Woesearchaeota archaeon]